MLDKTFEFILGENQYKSIGSSRTDAKVSANESLVHLQTVNELNDNFLDLLNLNLPPDIRALEINDFPENFNIIQSPKSKEYLYLFSFGAKPHPFSTSFLVNIAENLDIDLMKKGAKIFEGEHNFLSYCTKPSPSVNPVRMITLCEIVDNDFFRASFFPKKSYALRICSKGFMRNQVRLIMAQLFNLGKGEIELEDIRESLKNPSLGSMKSIAPASGLVLNRIDLET